MVKVNWTFKALEDIDEIAEHVAEYSSKYAEQIVEDLFGKGDFKDWTCLSFNYCQSFSQLVP